jgi:hypothetical protein
VDLWLIAVVTLVAIAIFGFLFTGLAAWAVLRGPQDSFDIDVRDRKQKDNN